MKRKNNWGMALTGPRWDAAAAVFFSILLFLCMHAWTEPFAVGMAVLALVLTLGRTPWRLARERFCVPALGFLAYVVLYGISAVWSPFGASSPREFRGALIAFAVAALVFFRVEKHQVRKLLWVLAAVCAVVSLLCTSFACDGPLYKALCSLMDLFHYGEVYRVEIRNVAGRVNGVYNDANVSGSILALGTLVSLYLAQTGKQWWERLLACLLVSTSAVGILLSVSRGAILCFGVSLLVWLIVTEKTQRFRLFLLMVIAAAVTGAASMAAMPMIAAGAVLPNVLAVASGGVIFLLDWVVGERIAVALSGHGRAITAVFGVIAAAAAVFAIAALNVTGPYEFQRYENIIRSRELKPGEYIMTVEGDFSEECRAYIYKVSDIEALLGETTVLYDGPLDMATFTVPEDASQVFFRLYGYEGDTFQSAFLSDGTKIPLDYKFLPEAIVTRLQRGIFSDNSYLLRVQFMKDALKLFVQKPVFGHGLGSTDNLYPAVQPFYYTSRYVHNHILQIMSDMGLLGLVSILAFIGGVLWLLIRQLRSSRDPLLALLLACWVMINTHSLMEINFSIQPYECVAFILLLLPVVLYGTPLSEAAAKMGGAAVCAVFWGYLAVFGWFLGQRQTVRRESTNLQVTNIGEAMAAMEDFARRDIFEPEAYEVQYVLSAVQNTTGEYDVKMLEYVEKLRYSGNYPACSSLTVGYYLKAGDFRGLFACSRDCMLQRASYAQIWNSEVEFYRDSVLPAAGAEHADEFAEGVLAFQALLDEVNRDRMQEVVLTEENQGFLDLVAEAVSAELSGAGLYDYLIYAMDRDTGS